MLTISEQELSAAQKAQVLSNIGAVAASDALWSSRQTLKEIKNGNTTVAYLYGRYNNALKLGFIWLVGNANTPPAATTVVSVALPAALKPVFSCVVPLKDGKYMEVRQDGNVNVVFTGTAYAGGAVMYPLT